MREEYNSVLSTPTEADKIGRFVNTDISVKPKYRSISIADLYHYDLCSPKKFPHTPLSGALQKYFQLSPALAKADPLHVCIFTIKLCHEFVFNLSRKPQ